MIDNGWLESIGGPLFFIYNECIKLTTILNGKIKEEGTRSLSLAFIFIWFFDLGVFKSLGHSWSKKKTNI